MTFVRNIYQKFLFIRYKKDWRRINNHNFTIPTSIFPLNSVLVGKKTYGFIRLESFNNPKEKLIIGNYVSIANNVVFILGGNHQVNTISTYPFYSKLISLKTEVDSLTKGSIIVEDEVWIGYGAIILSGVRLGKGSIIAAGAVVTKDVPSYAVVGGNPARIIKYRFNEEILEAMIDFNISDLNVSEIIDNIKLFYKTLDINSIEELKNVKTEKNIE